MSELLSCPFCGGEAALHPTYDMDTGGVDGWFAWCDNDTCECKPETGQFFTEAEATAAWNSRAPIEYDGWFYLPKPKEGIVDYGEPEITRTENGYKVRQIADVVDEAARRWSDELGDYVMKRMCEAWNSRAERTCHRVDVNGYSFRFECSACGYVAIVHNCSVRLDELPNYCPNCGAKVVGE